MALFQRYKWLAAAVGIVLTGVPLLWLTSWLQRQGEAEVAIAAHWSVGVTDLVIGQIGGSVNQASDADFPTAVATYLDLKRVAHYLATEDTMGE